MNPNNIKKNTNRLIGYEMFRKEEKERMRKIKKISLSIAIFAFFIAGTFTVNAMTDNKIVDAVKEALNLNVRVNGENKNAKCEKLDNGNIKCILDKEVTNDDNIESTIEINPEYSDNLEAELENNNLNITINEEK